MCEVDDNEPDNGIRFSLWIPFLLNKEGPFKHSDPTLKFLSNKNKIIFIKKGIQITLWLKLWTNMNVIYLIITLITLCHCFIHKGCILTLISHKTKHVSWCLVWKTWMGEEIKSRGWNTRKKVLDKEVK